MNQVAIFLVEALAIAALLLAFMRCRRTLGLALVYTTLGVLFYLSNLLATALYVKVSSGIVVSPGSVVIFPVILLVVLCIYVKEDAFEARRLIYGLLAANVSISLLGYLTTLHLTSASAINPYQLSPELFVQTPRIAIVGSLVLFVDTVIIILVYEALARAAGPRLFLAIWGSMTAVLVFDQIVFVTGAFVEKPGYGSILFSGLLGKLAAGLLYSVLLTVYLRWLDTVEPVRDEERRGLGRVFQVLTYRQRYEALRSRIARDPLTDVYNRGFFDEILPVQLAAARRSRRSLALIMCDIDHFKRINDTRGHRTGDRVLQEMASTLTASVRASDFVCRYGGEEFAILLPETDLAQAIVLAGRLRQAVAERRGTRGAPGAGVAVTVTLGLGVFPAEAGSAEELVELADARLYAGKRAGRDRVMPPVAPAGAGAGAESR